MPAPFRAVMFDLDGTLADTLRSIALAGNHMLGRLGLAALPEARYRHLAGQGARWLVEQAVGPEHQHQVDAGLAHFKAWQLAHGLESVTLYPGIPELLDGLTARGLRLAVLSNKPQRAVEQVVQHFLPRWRFDEVRGHEDQPGVASLKPDPAGALAISRRLGLAPDQWLYLGDTRTDMETAVNAGMFAVGALWGFRDERELRDSGARAIIAHPLDLLPLAEAR